MTDELEAKGAKKMANNLKEGKPVRWESIIEALTESDVSVYQVDDNFADNQMDADVKEVNNPFAIPKKKQKNQGRRTRRKSTRKSTRKERQSKEINSKAEKLLEEEEGSVDPTISGKGTPKLLDKKSYKKKKSEE